MIKNTAFKSQVLNYLGYQKDQLRRFNYIGSEKKSNIIGSKEEYLNIKKVIPNFIHRKSIVRIFHVKSYFSLTRHSILLAITLGKYYSFNKNIVLQCRTEFSSLPALMVKKIFPNISVIHEARGVHSKEIIVNELYGSKIIGYLKSRTMYAMEKYCYLHSDIIIAVSVEFKAYIKQICKRSNSIVVIPTCINPAMFQYSESDGKKLRWKYNFGDKIILSYSGGVQNHQNLGAVMDFYGSLSKYSDVYHLMLFSRETERMQQYVEDYGIASDRVTIKALNGEELSAHYSLCDYGFLFRENNAINMVASPIKIAEYFSHGLQIITNDFMADKYPEFEEGFITFGDSEFSDVEQKINQYDSILRLKLAMNKRLSLIDKTRELFSYAHYDDIYAKILK